MSSRSMPLIALAIVTVAVLAISFLNAASVALSILGATVHVPEGVLLGGGYLLGVLFTLPMFAQRAALGQASEQRLQEWEHQDKKLAQQVQTDREKQLEAKIATLEAALQRALKK